MRMRSKYRKEVEINRPELPDDDEPVTMSRLALIPSDQLMRSPSKLGEGAFGVVYAVSRL